jgi:hypothetical protein
VHARAAAVVGLKGPLALGHCSHSSLDLAATPRPTSNSMQASRGRPVVSSSVSHHCPARSPPPRVAAVSPRAGDCSRVLRRFRWVKPVTTPCTTPGEAFPGPPGPTFIRQHVSQPSRPPRRSAAGHIPSSGNVAELLAPGEKTVSFWQCRFHEGRRTTTK